jgi:hypothetical protein
MSNQGLWKCLFLQFPPDGFLLKVDFATAPTHCCSRSANSFASRCPIESTTHRFPKFNVKASWYSSIFDLSYLNLSKFFFVTTVCYGSKKLQSMFNRRCNGLWSESPPHCAVVGVIYYHFEVCSNLPNCRWANNIINNATPPICQTSELPWFVTRC